MTPLKVKYDPQVDILRILLNDTPIEESEEVEPGVIVDMDEEGNIIGIEILDASERLHRDTTPPLSAAAL